MVDRKRLRDDPMFRGAEALALLQEIARTPNHSRQIVGERAADILTLFDLYRTVIVQNQLDLENLQCVREALSLHKSMVLSGERPSEYSKHRFKEAMEALAEIGTIEVELCCKCDKPFRRSNMKVVESFAKAKSLPEEEWTLVCLNCWQAWLQTKLGILRVHVNRVLDTEGAAREAAIETLAEYERDWKKQRNKLPDFELIEDLQKEIAILKDRELHIEDAGREMDTLQ